jgi:hypothetical protein
MGGRGFFLFKIPILARDPNVEVERPLLRLPKDTDFLIEFVDVDAPSSKSSVEDSGWFLAYAVGRLVRDLEDDEEVEVVIVDFDGDLDIVPTLFLDRFRLRILTRTIMRIMMTTASTAPTLPPM